MTTPWTEAHIQEANARTYEIAAELHRMSNSHRRNAATLAQDEGTSEVWYRDALAYAGLDAARIEREDRRVRALAEATPEVRAMIKQARADHERQIGKLLSGRFTLAEAWRGESGEEYDERILAVRDKSHGGGTFTRVTRIRKATP